MYVRLPSHAFLFLVGGAIADLRRRVNIRLEPWAAALATLALLAIGLREQEPVIDHVELLRGTTRLAGLGLCALAVLVCAFASQEPSRWLAPLVWLGDHSYALYLVHPLTWPLTAKVLATGTSNVSAFGVGLLASFALSAVVHRVLERPCMALGRRLSAESAAALTPG